MPKPASSSADETDKFVGQDQIMLGVLSAVERDSQVSQRTISRELNVALGLANAYFKRCVRKGWIKIQQVPRRRYAYYLTPQGFSEKTRLATQYFSASFTFFRKARGQISELIEDCARRGAKRIAFAGVSDLAEVAMICSLEFPVTVAGVVDPERAGKYFCGTKVRATLDECGPVDAVIITHLSAPYEAYRALAEAIEPDRILVPALLRVALQQAASSEPEQPVGP